MADLDLEAEYDNRKRVPASADMQARWQKASDEFTKGVKGEVDLSYGPAARNKYDLYRPNGAGADTPLVVYIHGGYWQRGDRKMYGFVAKELNARGLAVALPSYSLCPAVDVIDIVGELRQFMKALWEKTKRRPVVVGHSAGGHLAAAMLATDWTKVGGVPADLVRTAYALSGVFDLEPLITTSLNEALKLDAAKARAASPVHWPAPGKDRMFVAAAGGSESQEFIRQSLLIAAAWSKAGVKAECVVVPDANHFTIVEELVRSDSAMQARIIAMAKG